MVRRTGLRQVPWQSWAHWMWVADGIFSDSNDRIAAAQNRIKAWQGRGNVPISVETTSALTSIQQRDPHFNHALLPGGGLPDDMLRMMYAMAIQRLVNGVVDVSGQRNSSSVAKRADSAGLPRLLVDIRHETAHNELPWLPLLRSASEKALEWLKVHYWDSQRQVLGNLREELKTKLLEHCQLVIDILTPISRPDDEGSDDDDVGDGKQRLVKVMRTMRNLHRRKLKAMKQERAKLFHDLEELCLSSTSELISILVDDGLLEQGVLPGPEGGNHAEMESEDSDTGSFDLAAATYTAWRYTICHLSNQLPRLPAMLLVAIVKRIGSCRGITGQPPESVVDAAGPNAVFSAPALPLMARSSSTPPKDSPDENENRHLSTAGRNHLIAWCTWLLGSEDSGASLDSIPQEAVKSRTLGIGRKISVKADLNEELCRELLRSCLYLTSQRRPLVELVSLIALKIGSNKLQKQALILSKFGSIVHSTCVPNHKLESKLEEDLILGSAASLCGPPSGGEALEASAPCLDQSQGIMTASDLDDSNYDRVKKQQQEFFARAASEGNVGTRSRFHGEGAQENEDSRIAASEGWAKSQAHGNRSPVLQGRKWSVAEKWRPCALGMIPSPYSVIGILPPLDLTGVTEADDEMSDRQATGGESHSRLQQVDTAEDTGKDRVAGNAGMISFGSSVAKRKSCVEASSPTGGRRAKKAGRHVHFSATDEETRNTCLSPAAKQVTGSKIQGSREEQLSGGSLLQGCLRWHGHFTHVSPQQLDSLKAAVHVL